MPFEQSKRNKKEVSVGAIIKWFGIGIVLFTFLFGSFYTIPAGEQGVLLTFGKADPFPKDQGLHAKFPIAQSVVKYEVRTQKIEVQSDSSSKDLQDVQTIIALNYHVIPSEVSKLHVELGQSYRERVINPAIEESVKAITARFTAEELITKRPEVRDGIAEQLKERLSKYFVIVDSFNIVNFQFSEEFDKAIEQKVTAEQLKLKADRDLERIRVEAEQKVTQAQAEAEALKLQKQEITPDLIKLRQIEVQRTAIEKWDGILPQVTGTGAVPFIEVPTNIGS